MEQIEPINDICLNNIEQSHKLDNICYDIRGPVLEEAQRLEGEGHEILKLNIGNPAAFDFNASNEVLLDVVQNLHNAQGYSNSKGLHSAREAIMQECKTLEIANVKINDIYLGNGVSELIMIAMQALLNDSDEVLIPAPDYPLWTAAVSLSGGQPIHYVCDEQADWFPSITDIESKITDRSRALVIINPNNPTGAVYSHEILLDLIELARKHKLILFADEIYSKIVYDDAKYIPAASLCDDLFIVTFNGLSKSYRLAGFRSGWMILSGPKEAANNYIEGLEILTNMRLCANVPAQLAIQAALGGYQNINELTLPGGRLLKQRDLAWQLLNQIPGVSCVKPKGAIYLFPCLDPMVYKIDDDIALILDILNQKKILVVQGSAFNIGDKQHLRLVFLPKVDELRKAVTKISSLLEQYRSP